MRKVKPYVLLVCLGVAVVLLCLTPNFTQVQAQSPMQGMDMSTAGNVIDGSVNPEKITDRDAYKMFLIDATLKYDDKGNLLDGEAARQQSRFSRLNLDADHQAIVSQIVADFATEFQVANAAWDAAARVSTPTPSDEAAHRKQIRGIVDEAMTKFELGLGGKSRSLNALIQGEKRNMRIAVED
jgi:hypothetical protein